MKRLPIIRHLRWLCAKLLCVWPVWRLFVTRKVLNAIWEGRA